MLGASFRREYLSRDLLLLAIGLACATLFGFLGDVAWYLDLFSGFVPWYVLLAALIALAAFFLDADAALAVSSCVLAANLTLVAPYFVTPRAPPPARATPKLSILHFNVRLENWSNAEAIARYLDDSGADVVATVETDGVWVDLLRAHMPHYALVTSSTDGWRNPYFGTALFVRHGIESRVRVHSAQVEFFDPTRGHPAISAEIVVGGRKLGLVAVHQHPPISRIHYDIRANQYRGVTAWLLAHRNAVLVGDLNATPWSLPYRRLARAARLENAQRGYGLHDTYFPFGELLPGLPIDHCLHTLSLVATAFSIGPSFGSDHRPLRVELAFR